MVKTMGVEFFCYHRDRPGSMTLRDKLLEQALVLHGPVQAEMIARGPTLAGDGDTPTGSVHIVGQLDPAAARAFAFDGPATRPVCTGTCCCAGGAIYWGAPCGTSPAAGRR